MEWKYQDEVVEAEKWQWIAKYKDGTELRQFDVNGVFHRFHEIDQEKLSSFSMVHKDGQHDPFFFSFPIGAKLIHFYRNKILNIGQENEMRVRLYCFGFEANQVKVLFVIMPDDHLVITDNIDRIKIHVTE